MLSTERRPAVAPRRARNVQIRPRIPAPHMNVKSPLRTLPLLPIVLCACEPAEDVRVQDLPALERSSIEARLGLPELRGPWRFAGWELSEGDTLGLEAELPAFGVLFLQTQKRDSVGGFYLTAGGGRAPLYGEVRRDSVVALVTFPGPEEGRFLVGDVAGDTLWVEATTLAEPGSWRGDARAAFVRGQAAPTPFRRVRGAFVAAAPVDSAALAAAADSLPPVGAAIPGMPGATSGGVVSGQAPTGAAVGGAPPAARPAAPITRPSVETGPPVSQPQARPVTPPVTEAEPVEAEEEEPEEEVPAPVPSVQREPPRVLGVPVVRDTAGGNLP